MSKPFLKWVGGKRKLLSIINNYIPNNIDTYAEPFIGGGAVLFDLFKNNKINKASIGDSNSELLLTYSTLKYYPDNVYNILQKYIEFYNKNPEKNYYLIREEQPACNKKIAARFIFLNRTCFNGLYRVNKNNKFNVPHGKYKNPKFPTLEELNNVSKVLNKTYIFTGDFEGHINSFIKIKKTDIFIYLDSPYDPISKTASFTSYTKNGFSKEDQIRLFNCFDKLTKNNIKALLSNSCTNFVLDLYKKYDIIKIDVKRNIAAKKEARNIVKEVLIKNY